MESLGLLHRPLIIQLFGVLDIKSSMIYAASSPASEPDELAFQIFIFLTFFHSCINILLNQYELSRSAA